MILLHYLIPQDDYDSAALPHQLNLATGHRVMLCCNINCGDGLVNGARGITAGFKWSGRPNNQVKYLQRYMYNSLILMWEGSQS